MVSVFSDESVTSFKYKSNSQMPERLRAIFKLLYHFKFVSSRTNLHNFILFLCVLSAEVKLG